MISCLVMLLNFVQSQRTNFQDSWPRRFANVRTPWILSNWVSFYAFTWYILFSCRASMSPLHSCQQEWWPYLEDDQCGFQYVRKEVGWKVREQLGGEEETRGRRGNEEGVCQSALCVAFNASHFRQISSAPKNSTSLHPFLHALKAAESPHIHVPGSCSTHNHFFETQRSSL